MVFSYCSFLIIMTLAGIVVESPIMIQRVILHNVNDTRVYILAIRTVSEILQ